MNFSNVSSSHGLQFFTTFSSVGPSHVVQFLQAQAAPAWVPHGVTSPASKLAPAWAPLPTGPRILPETCSSMDSPQGHSLLWTSTCSGVGPHPGCRWRSAPPWTSMGCRGTACLTVIFITGCRGVSAVAAGAPPPPPSSLTLVSAELFLTRIVTPSSHCRFFFPLLKHVIPEALPLSLMGSALASSRSILELAGIGSVRHGGSFWQVLTEATPLAPLLPKPCHANSIQQVACLDLMSCFLVVCVVFFLF